MPSATQERSPKFATDTIQNLRALAESGPAGNRWFKVNLHVHGEGSSAADVVAHARAADLDLIAITDHQSFRFCDDIIAAASSPGRPLTVLPGIEVTTLEGVHLLAVFPSTQSTNDRTELKGWFDFQGDGDTRQASRKPLHDILHKVDEVGGVVIVPHPFTEDIGMLDGARKMSTKLDWLETGHVRLIQVPEDRVKYVERDAAGNWVNRYVIATAQPEQIRSSSHCLAPFNRSDAHSASEIGDGCSWFLMSEPSVAGLKQVACEPRARIQRTEPAAHTHNCVLGLAVTGGYFDGERFNFSDGLTCVIGQNYAGKSSLLDFVRFVLGQDRSIQNAGDKDKFLSRLNGILQPGGMVEAYLRIDSNLHVVRRTFTAIGEGTGPKFKFTQCDSEPVFYRFDPATGQLDPVGPPSFPLEVYEQGRIGRLRDDLQRQLDMLDEFAGTEDLKNQRGETIRLLSESADRLAPLYEERDRLNEKVTGLPQLEAELTEQERHLPGDQEKRWAASQAFVTTLDAETKALREAAEYLEALPADTLDDDADFLDILFTERSAPDLNEEKTLHPEVLKPWQEALQATFEELKAAKEKALAAVDTLGKAAALHRAAWKTLHDAHEGEVAAQLAKAGVESPKELLKRVQVLRAEIEAIKSRSRPRLAELGQEIDRKETARNGLLRKLKTLNTDISARRQERAAALTAELNEQIKVILRPNADDGPYRAILQDLTAQQRVHADQLPRITAKLTPLELAEALIGGGKHIDNGTPREIHQVCGITEHTQTVLSRAAEDIKKLNRLQTTLVEDSPEILVKRRGEDNYANLRNELSPGEQSAALLMLALQTHSLPLIIDQPEDELGYDYVVHLVVPALLGAKASRQVIAVTHNANIAVLGDSDHVCKLENHPSPDGGRHCRAGVSGSFENPEVTKAMLDLEGGRRAFQFRLHRYALEKGARPDKLHVLKPTQAEAEPADPFLPLPAEPPEAAPAPRLPQ